MFWAKKKFGVFWSLSTPLPFESVLDANFFYFWEFLHSLHKKTCFKKKQILSVFCISVSLSPLHLTPAGKKHFFSIFVIFWFYTSKNVFWAKKIFFGIFDLPPLLTPRGKKKFFFYFCDFLVLHIKNVFLEKKNFFEFFFYIFVYLSPPPPLGVTQTRPNQFLTTDSDSATPNYYMTKFLGFDR